MPQEPPTDEQQCQEWRENSNKKALRLAEGGRLFLFREVLEGLTHRSFSLRASVAIPARACPFGA